MVINSNLAGTGGTPLAKSNNRAGSSSKLTSPSDNPSEFATLATLDSHNIAVGAGSEIGDSAAALASAQLARTQILNQSATALLAQANVSHETALKLLEE